MLQHHHANYVYLLPTTLHVCNATCRCVLNIVSTSDYTIISQSSFFFFFQSVLRWSIAVFTICRHSSRVVAFLQAVMRPKFRGPSSASIARSQVWLGLPAGHFQSGSTWRIHAARAQWWSLRGELRAIWPKSCRHLLVTRWESGEQPVVLLTSAFDTWRAYGILKILCSAHVSNASRQESRYFVVAQVLHPYIKTGTVYVCVWLTRQMTTPVINEPRESRRV